MSANPSAFDAFKPMAGRVLESALNRALDLDPDTRASVGRLEGKRIALALAAPSLALELTVAGGRLKVGPVDSRNEPDLGLQATLGGLLAQLPFLRAANSTPVGKLRINGDAELARTLQQLADRFDPDWDKPFAQALGPLLGPQVARVLREGLRAGRNAAGNFARDSAEFLTEESRDVVAKAELEAFHDDVDALRDCAERLIARVARLAAKHGESA